MAGQPAQGEPPVDLVVEAWNSHDPDRLLPFFAPDCEIVSTLRFSSEPYRGHTGLRRWLVEATESFEGFTVSVVDSRWEPGGFLVLARADLQGSASGIELSREVAYVTELDGSLIKRLRVFPSHSEAEAAVAA